MIQLKRIPKLCMFYFELTFSDHISKVNTPGSRYLKEQKKTETENWIKGILAKETKDYKNLERRVESVMKNVDMPVLGREIQKGSTFQLELTDDEEE